MFVLFKCLMESPHGKRQTLYRKIAKRFVRMMYTRLERPPFARSIYRKKKKQIVMAGSQETKCESRRHFSLPISNPRRSFRPANSTGTDGSRAYINSSPRSNVWRQYGRRHAAAAQASRRV